MDFLAHVRELDNGQWDKPQLLENHLFETAELVKKFASDFESEEWGYALGMLHDIGKATPEWQDYFLKKSGYDEELASEAPGKVEHSGPGAKLAEEVFGMMGRPLSYCIAGHHAGLPDWMGSGSQSVLGFRLQKSSTSEICEKYRNLVKNICLKTLPWKFDNNSLDLSLWIRMLFSCLIDADRLNTEKYMDPEQSENRVWGTTIEKLHECFNNYMATKTQKPQSSFEENVYYSRIKSGR